MIESEKSIKDLTVIDVMRREVMPVEAEWSIEKLAGFLVGNNISGAPVISDSGELIGVVSLTDIVRHKNMPETGGQSSDPHEYYFTSLEYQLGREEIKMYHIEQESSVCVQDIMTPMIYAVSEETSLQEVADTMIKGRIHRVFVIKDKRLVGIVAALDMLQVIREL